MPPILPFELQEEVVQSVDGLSRERGVDYGTLAACSRVCASWTPIAQTLLFRSIPDTVHGRDVSASRLLQSIRADPLLGTYVRAITIGSGFKGRDDIGNDTIFHLLRLCPNITEFVAYVPLNGFAWWGHRSALGHLQLLSLKLAGGPAETYELLKLWPTVTSLSLHHSGYKFDGMPPLSGALRKISLVWVLLSDEHLRWLLSLDNPDSALSILDLHHCIPNVERTTLRLIAARDPRRIRSLSCFSIPPVAVLERFEALEKLAFMLLPEGRFTLPRSVRHVAFLGKVFDSDGTRTEEQMDNLCDALRVLPGLQLITTTRLASPRVVERLERMCRAAHIQFRVYADAEGSEVEFDHSLDGSPSFQ